MVVNVRIRCNDTDESFISQIPTDVLVNTFELGCYLNSNTKLLKQPLQQNLDLVCERYQLIEVFDTYESLFRCTFSITVLSIYEIKEQILVYTQFILIQLCRSY